MRNIKIEIPYLPFLLTEATIIYRADPLVIEKDLVTKTFTAYGKFLSHYTERDDQEMYLTQPVEVPKDLIEAINEKNLLALNEFEEDPRLGQLDGGTYKVNVCIDGEATEYLWDDSEMETQHLLKLLSRWYNKEGYSQQHK